MNLLQRYRRARKQKTQVIILATEDGRLEPYALPVELGYCSAEPARMAWGIDTNAMVRDPHDNTNTLFVTERSYIPLFAPENKNYKTINDISHEARKQAIYEVERKQSRAKFEDTLRFVMLILAITVIVMVIAGLVMTGKIHITNPIDAVKGVADKAVIK